MHFADSVADAGRRIRHRCDHGKASGIISSGNALKGVKVRAQIRRRSSKNRKTVQNAGIYSTDRERVPALCLGRLSVVHIVVRPMSRVQEYFEVINPQTVGSLTIPRASIRWV